jgi:hypothetical protein
VNGRTRLATDFIPLSSNKIAKYTGTTMSKPRISAFETATIACFVGCVLRCGIATGVLGGRGQVSQLHLRRRSVRLCANSARLREALGTSLEARPTRIVFRMMGSLGRASSGAARAVAEETKPGMRRALHAGHTPRPFGSPGAGRLVNGGVPANCDVRGTVWNWAGDRHCPALAERPHPVR